MWLSVLWMGLAHAVTPGPLAGTWTYAGGDSERAAVDAVRNDVAKRFNALFRGIVRNRLAKPMTVDEQIVISGDEQNVSIQLKGDYPRESKGLSDGVTRKTQDDQISYSHLLETNTLTFIGENEEGGRKTIYKLVNDNTLEMHNTLWSPRMGEPITWTLTYEKSQ